MNKIFKTATVFELATSMTVYKWFIHYATNISLWLVCAYNILNIIKFIYCSKNSELMLLVNTIIVNTERQHSRNNAVGL